MNDLQQNIKSGRQNIKTCCWDCKYQLIADDTFCYSRNKLKRFKNCDIQMQSA